MATLIHGANTDSTASTDPAMAAQRETARARENRPASYAHFERARRVIPRGAIRARLWWPNPIYFEHGKGAYIFDIDGNRYLDCHMGSGPLVIGHAHPTVIEAIQRQSERGSVLGPSVREVELAEKITGHVPGAEWVAILNSGTEATLAALRIARAATGRTRVAKFEGGFHGWHDFLLFSYSGLRGDAGAPLPLANSIGISAHLADDLLILPFNDDRAFAILREHASELACVTLEGILGASGAIPPNPEFVRKLRQVCDEEGLLLMLDEVITGFRLGATGAAGHFQIRADLTTLGKSIGGGLPIGAVCGSEALRKVAESPTLIMGGTFSANPLSLAAGCAHLDTLLSNPANFDRLNALGDDVRSGLTSLVEKLHIPAHVTGLGSIWSLHFTPGRPYGRRDLLNEDKTAAQVLPSYLLREGVLASAPMHLCFLSTAHSEHNVTEIVEAHERALTAMRRDGFFQ